MPEKDPENFSEHYAKSISQLQDDRVEADNFE